MIHLIYKINNKQKLHFFAVVSFSLDFLEVSFWHLLLSFWKFQLHVKPKVLHRELKFLNISQSSVTVTNT